jgi:hypothetical protein
VSGKSDRGLGAPGKLSQAIPAAVAIPFKDSDKRELTGGTGGVIECGFYAHTSDANGLEILASEHIHRAQYGERSPNRSGASLGIFWAWAKELQAIAQ